MQKELIFTNEVVNKKKLQSLMEHTFHNYGVIKSSLISDLKSSSFLLSRIGKVSFASGSFSTIDFQLLLTFFSDLLNIFMKTILLFNHLERDGEPYG